MKFTAAEIASFLKGTVVGDPDAVVTDFKPIEVAETGHFAFLDNPKYEAYAYTTRASVLMVHHSFTPTQAIVPTLVRVDDVRSSLALLLEYIEQLKRGKTHFGEAPKFVHQNARIGVGTTIGAYAVIESGAVIGNNCIIYPHVFIGKDVVIGDGCSLYPGVKVHFACKIGDHCILHANAVIGADGFGFAPQEDKTWVKVPQVGNVVLEDNVEIGACTCIDRASLGSTVVRRGAKLDNLIHIGHNAELGQNVVMAAQVGVAGSTRIGSNSQVGGQVGFAGHINIADSTRIQAQSGLASSITEPGQSLFGSPAIGYKDFIRSHVVFKQLPDLQRKVLQLEKQLKAMEAQINGHNV